jgi:tripartite-type tricarboxylate transporter receptor subunit TctC
LAEVPPIGDFVRGYEALAWQGMSAPKGTPAAIVNRLNREINAVLADPKVNARFKELGNTPVLSTPAEYGKFCADEVEKWRKVIRFGGIKPE